MGQIDRFKKYLYLTKPFAKKKKDKKLQKNIYMVTYNKRDSLTF